MESFSQIKLSIPTSRAYRCRAAVSQSSSPSQILISRSMAHIVSDLLAFFCQQNDTTRAPVTPAGQSRLLTPRSVRSDDCAAPGPSYCVTRGDRSGRHLLVEASGSHHRAGVQWRRVGPGASPPAPRRIAAELGLHENTTSRINLGRHPVQLRLGADAARPSLLRRVER
jgi:hypothetical protein